MLTKWAIVNSDQSARPDAGRQPNATVPFTRISALAPFIHFLDTLGAPTERLLRQARIPALLLDEPEALLPLFSAYRFVELAARLERIEDLGLVVGSHTYAFDLGAFGASLQNASTLEEYLQEGIQRIDSVTTGERFWLTAEGDAVRFHHFAPSAASTSRYLADTYALAVTLNTIRQFVGPDWTPDDVRLLADIGITQGIAEIFGDARITPGQSHSSFTIPRALLHRQVSKAVRPVTPSPVVPWAEGPNMPVGFRASITQLILTFLGEGYPDINVTAESAGMSARTLQRRLCDIGVTYSDLVAQCRMRLAGTWLLESDMPIAEIAAELGYTDASNFSRAFRRQAGVSPHKYRLRKQQT